MVWWWLRGHWVHRAVAESMLSVGPIGHDADVETGGAWGGPSVLVRGETVVAPGAHLTFLIVVEMWWCVCSNVSFALFLYNYCLFLNTKVCVVWWWLRGRWVHRAVAESMLSVGAGPVCQRGAKPW
jgi:hypothetical protein